MVEIVEVIYGLVQPVYVILTLFDPNDAQSPRVHPVVPQVNPPLVISSLPVAATVPFISSFADGVLVPIPIDPLLVILICSVLLVLNTRSVASVVPMKSVNGSVPIFHLSSHHFTKVSNITSPVSFTVRYFGISGLILDTSLLSQLAV